MGNDFNKNDRMIEGVIRISPTENTDTWKRDVRGLVGPLLQNNYVVRSGTKEHIQSNVNTIPQKIAQSQGFVMAPNISTGEFAKAQSLFVGKQTVDPNLVAQYPNEGSLGTKDDHPKAFILYNPKDKETGKGFYDGFIKRAESYGQFATIRQNPRDIFTEIDRPKDLIEAIQAFEKMPVETNIHGHAPRFGDIDSFQDLVDMGEFNYTPWEGDKPDYMVVNYSSANSSFSPDSERALIWEFQNQFGQEVAKNGVGYVSGAGDTGLMGAGAEGVFEQGGYHEGYNLLRIIQHEGLPDIVGQYAEVDDIYIRQFLMNITPDNTAVPLSDPLWAEKQMTVGKPKEEIFIQVGGGGTLQELDVGIDMNQQLKALGRDPIRITINNIRVNEQGIPDIDGEHFFHEETIKDLEERGFEQGKDFHVNNITLAKEKIPNRPDVQTPQEAAQEIVEGVLERREQKRFNEKWNVGGNRIITPSDSAIDMVNKSRNDGEEKSL